MNHAPTPEQIEENDRQRSAIYAEQERSMKTFIELERRAEKLEEGINTEIRDLWLEWACAVEDRDNLIEELEGKIQALTEEKEEAESRLEEIMEKRA